MPSSGMPGGATTSSRRSSVSSTSGSIFATPPSSPSQASAPLRLPKVSPVPPLPSSRLPKPRSLSASAGTSYAAHVTAGLVGGTGVSGVTGGAGAGGAGTRPSASAAHSRADGMGGGTGASPSALPRPGFNARSRSYGPHPGGRTSTPTRSPGRAPSAFKTRTPPVSSIPLRRTSSSEGSSSARTQATMPRARAVSASTARTPSVSAATSSMGTVSGVNGMGMSGTGTAGPSSLPRRQRSASSGLPRRAGTPNNTTTHTALSPTAPAVPALPPSSSPSKKAPSPSQSPTPTIALTIPTPTFARTPRRTRAQSSSYEPESPTIATTHDRAAGAPALTRQRATRRSGSTSVSSSPTVSTVPITSSGYPVTDHNNAYSWGSSGDRYTALPNGFGLSSGKSHAASSSAPTGVEEPSNATGAIGPQSQTSPKASRARVQLSPKSSTSSQPNTPGSRLPRKTATTSPALASNVVPNQLSAEAGQSRATRDRSRSPKSSKSPSATSSSVAPTVTGTGAGPGAGVDNEPPRTSPRGTLSPNDTSSRRLSSHRKSMGLTIDPPPSSHHDLANPPPLPAKSPLRAYAGVGPGSRRSIMSIPPVPPLPPGAAPAPTPAPVRTAMPPQPAYAPGGAHRAPPPATAPAFAKPHPPLPSHPLHPPGPHSAPVPSLSRATEPNNVQAQESPSSANLTQPLLSPRVSHEDNREPAAAASDSVSNIPARSASLGFYDSPSNLSQASSTISMASVTTASSTSATLTHHSAVLYAPVPVAALSAPAPSLHTHSDTDAPYSSATVFTGYNQESAPPSAPPSSSNSWAISASTRPESGIDLATPLSENGPSENMIWAHSPTTHNTVHFSPRLDGALELPEQNDRSASPISVHKPHPTMPRSPTSSRHADQTMRSPSMPTLQKGQRTRGLTESSPSPPVFARSQTGPGGLQPSAMIRPKSMMVSSSPMSPATPPLSRRAHLIREIANTERAHANDLMLIRDAYLGAAAQVRPDSHHSTTTTGGDSTHSTPVTESRGHTRRSSSYGLPEELRSSGHERRFSGQDPSWLNAWSGIRSPVLRKGSREHLHHANGDSIDSLYSMRTASSATSTTSVHHLSPRLPSTPGSASGRMGPPAVPRPLALNDLKSVFLNIAQLAAISDELATEFEGALGSLEDESPAPLEEAGPDHVGEVFMRMLPRLRPLYTYYCSRQATASARLIELQADAGHAAHLNNCWHRVKGYTHAWNLDSMLIKPVQRVTKYPLLFEDLLACTTPVHPDYFSIRNAAESARSLALEIDAAKRRKDVITNVIGKSTSTVTLVKEPKPSGAKHLLALRRFKKDKSGSSSPDPSASLGDITPFAQTQLKEYVSRLQEMEKGARRLGKDMLDWTSTSKDVVNQMIEMNMRMLRIYTLDSKTSTDKRVTKLAAYRSILDTILTPAWEEMHEQVCNSIMLMLGKLLDAAKNPLMIIERLNAKSPDYARYVAQRQAKKSIERTVLQEAADYAAIHTQLLEELPVFLEGYSRIFDMSVAAFTGAQARFYATIRDKLAEFSAQFLTEPTEQVNENGEIKDVRVDVGTPRGVHRAWLDGWRGPNNAVKSLAILGGAGARPPDTLARPPDTLARPPNTRTASTTTTRSTTGFSIRSRPSSRSGNPSPSVHSERSESSGSRRRSRSLTGAMSPPEQTQSRFSGLIRRNSHRTSATSAVSATSSNGHMASKAPAPFSLRPGERKRTQSRSTIRSSVASLKAEAEERLSFGLPRIQPDAKLIEDLSGLGLSHVSPPQSMYGRVTPASQYDSLGLASPTSNDTQHASVGHTGVNGNRDDAPQDVMVHVEDGIGGFVSVVPPTPPSSEDPGLTWRGSRVLYHCTAVADFAPTKLGNHRFQGLHFVPLVAGDTLEVYHEVGRVSDLPDFPYSQVGVDNDGAVVCRAEDGMIGIAMCSFLEPLQK